MKRLIFAFCAILICSTALVCGCAQEDERDYSLYLGQNLTEAYYISMNTDAILTVYEGGNTASVEDNARIRKLADGVYDILEDIEAAISSTKKTSDISRFNEAEAGEELQISPITYNVLSIAKKLYNDTEGYYNPAVYYGVQAFGFNSSSNFPQTVDELPAADITDKYADLASHFVEVKIEEREGNFYVTKPAYTVEVNGEHLTLKIDLGGVGKGYATDMVSEYLDEKGFTSAIFNFGGSSISAKTYRGGNFNFSFADPRSNGQAYISAVQLQNECVSTSGDYENYFEIDGVRYCHIIDPFTARPVQTGIMVATVIGGSAAENDGYTTAIMAMGTEKAIKFVNTLSNRRTTFAFTMESEGVQQCYYYTNIPDGDYTLSGNNYSRYGGKNVA